MQVTVNLSKSSGRKELVEVLWAAKLSESAPHRPRNPVDFPITVVVWVVHQCVSLTLSGLEKTIRAGLSRVLCQKNHKKTSDWFAAVKGVFTAG